MYFMTKKNRTKVKIFRAYSREIPIFNNEAIPEKNINMPLEF